MSDTYLADALDALGDRRRVFVAALCEQRDRYVGAGDHGMALVFNALAAEIAGRMDQERATLRAMAADLSPVVRPLTEAELAEVHFDDEPTEPPC